MTFLYPAKLIGGPLHGRKTECGDAPYASFKVYNLEKGTREEHIYWCMGDSYDGVHRVFIYKEKVK